MTTHFVKYPQALKMKELGFNEPCLAYWYTYSGVQLLPVNLRWGPPVNVYGGEQPIPAPLYQQAILWFFDKHEILISLESNGDACITFYLREFYCKDWATAIEKAIEIVEGKQKKDEG